MSHVRHPARIAAIALALLFAAFFENAAQAKEFTLHRAERGVIDKTNQQRGRFGIAPLRMSPRLMKLARRHAQWMSESGNFQHSRFGVAENIAWGQSDSSEAVNDWMNSPGHRANLLGGYTHIGVAWSRGSDGRLYWVQQFASGEKDEEEEEKPKADKST